MSAPRCPPVSDALREIFPSQVALQEQKNFLEQAQVLAEKIKQRLESFLKERYRLPNAQAARNVIWKRFGDLLEKESLADAFQSLDALTPRQKSHFLKWAAKNKNLRNILIAAAYDVGPQLSVDLISHLSGLPIPNVGYMLRMPELHFFEPTAQELTLAWESGIERLKPNLIARYQNHAMGELYYQYARKRLADVGIVFGVYYVSQNWDAVVLNYKLARFLVSMLETPKSKKCDLVLGHQTEIANALRFEFSNQKDKVTPETIWVVSRDTLRLTESDLFGTEAKSGIGQKKVETARAPQDDSVLEAGTLALARLMKEAKPGEQGSYAQVKLAFLNWAVDYVSAKKEFQRRITPEMDEEQIWASALKTSHSPAEAELMIEETYRDSVTKNSPRVQKFKQIFHRYKKPTQN